MIKAARVRSGADIQALAPFHTDFHLLDSFVSGLPGGTGETFAWDLARAHGRSTPVILSGGLTPENVGEAIATVRPYAVDVASGVEFSPGRKDPAKLDAFARAVALTQCRGGRHAMSAVQHRFGPYGGQYVPETLMPALSELEAAWVDAWEDAAGFRAELDGCCGITSVAPRRSIGRRG